MLLMKFWLQFQTEGKVHTADFVLKVEKGSANDNQHEGMEHGHEHQKGAPHTHD